MEIIARYDCPVCKGTGTSYNPLWKTIFDIDDPAAPSFTPYNLTLLEIRKYFESRGYKTIPPEIIPCPHCNSKGYHIEHVEIQSFIKLYLVSAIQKIMHEQTTATPNK